MERADVVKRVVEAEAFYSVGSGSYCWVSKRAKNFAASMALVIKTNNHREAEFSFALVCKDLKDYIF